MTEEQYENLMYALSTLIGIAKWQAKPQTMPGMDAKTYQSIFETQIKDQADIVYKNLMDSLPKREGVKNDN